MSHYEMNWLAVFNDLLSGFCQGMGFCCALLLVYLMIERLAKKKKDKEAV